MKCLLTLLLAAASCLTHAAEPTQRVDVCVYGATPSGIVAAVTARQEGCSVLIVEPGRWVGGILGAGIKPLQDCPVPVAVGGLTATRVFKMGRQPDVLRKDFANRLAEEKIPVIHEQRVQRVEKAGESITRLILELAPPDKHGIPAPTATQKDVTVIEAKVFIDASYEGDVMAAAGVKYAVGRESAETYHEELAGVGPTTNWTPIDPYVKAGDPKSGLLPWVEADHGLPKGAADDYTQAYNFRFYVTRDPQKRAPLEKPANYDAKDFELVGRYVEYLVRTTDDAGKLTKRLRDIFPGWLNSGDYNYKRDSLITMAPLGLSRFLSRRHLGDALKSVAAAPGLPQRTAPLPQHRCTRAGGVSPGDGGARPRPNHARRDRWLAEPALCAHHAAHEGALRPHAR